MNPQLSHQLHQLALYRQHDLLREATYARLLRLAAQPRHPSAVPPSRVVHRAPSFRSRLAALLLVVDAWLDDTTTASRDEALDILTT